MKFEVGEMYSTRSVCNWDTVFAYQVVSRTDKTVTFLSVLSDTPKRVKVRVDEQGREWAMPDGQYSMCPVIRAEEDSK